LNCRLLKWTHRCVYFDIWIFIKVHCHTPVKHRSVFLFVKFSKLSCCLLGNSSFLISQGLENDIVRFIVFTFHLAFEIFHYNLNFLDLLEFNFKYCSSNDLIWLYISQVKFTVLRAECERIIVYHDFRNWLFAVFR